VVSGYEQRGHDGRQGREHDGNGGQAADLVAFQPFDSGAERSDQHQAGNQYQDDWDQLGEQRNADADQHDRDQGRGRDLDPQRAPARGRRLVRRVVARARRYRASRWRAVRSRTARRRWRGFGVFMGTVD
jgi:hypothetical protein